MKSHVSLPVMLVRTQRSTAHHPVCMPCSLERREAPPSTPASNRGLCRTCSRSIGCVPPCMHNRWRLPTSDLNTAYLHACSREATCPQNVQAPTHSTPLHSTPLHNSQTPKNPNSNKTTIHSLQHPTSHIPNVHAHRCVCISVPVGCCCVVELFVHAKSQSLTNSQILNPKP